MPKKEITSHFPASSAILNELIRKNVLLQESENVSRIAPSIASTRKPFTLNPYQQKAFEEVKEAFKQKNVCLLHGVTSSGKTEIYIHLIQEMLDAGKQCLFLVPEIALTTQLTSRLQAVFGNRMGVYHSGIEGNERTEIWQKMLSDHPYEVVLGVRSSLFLPFRNLGLVVVDEEHETSYKQQDPAPRYHARDMAVILAHQFSAKTLLGSATPSIESYYNASIGKYALVELNKRFEGVEMPLILIENTFELRRKKKMKAVLTPTLIEKINEALENNQQAILFRNRRGFAPMMECKMCGWTPKCRYCDVSLTYHKHRNELKCHYCNHVYRVVTECPVCHSQSVEMMGLGTEKLAEEVQELFPEATVARMDTDTTRNKNAYARIIRQFEEGKTQILVGTQMLSKGLDFENVSIVGIISADSLLNHPDFRAHERGFQLMMQAAGRAGRKNKQGQVVIQAASPEQPVYQYLAANDYKGFYTAQLKEREMFHYPPFQRLISITLKHKNEQTVDKGAHWLAQSLKKPLGTMVLGPTKPVISRIQLYHIRQILLKFNVNTSPSKIRELIRSVESDFREQPDFKYVVVQYDVDPA